MNVVDIINPDWKVNEWRLAKDMVDFGMGCYGVMSTRNAELAKLYCMYHGKYSQEELDEMTLVHGQRSSTPLKPYRLPKIKIDQLLGEALEVGFAIEVDTVSPVEKQNKKNEQMKAIGRSYSKPVIESVKKQGFNIYNGVDIPDFQRGDQFDPQDFRTRNELISQRIMDSKIKDIQQANIYYYAFAANVFASEIALRTIVDHTGKTALECIEPERMIYPMTNYDQFNTTVPIIGHWSFMTFSEILRTFRIKKDSEKYREIVALFGNTIQGGPPAVHVPVNNDGTFNFNGAVNVNDSMMTASVYQFQWRYIVEKGVKQKTDGSYDVKDIKSEEDKEEIKKSGSHSIASYERIFQGASINGQVYVGFDDAVGYPTSMDADGNVHANYDYICALVKTFGGKRTSFAKVLFEIGRQYDYSKFLLYRAIRKAKDASIYIDRSFMDGRKVDSVLYDLEDKGVIDINSKKRFDETGEGLTDGKQVVGNINAGGSSSLIRDLIAVCLDLEHTLDTITAMNDSRKGTEMATTTATVGQNNLQASRSATYDNFYFTENVMQRAATQLVQKTKSCIYNGSKEHYGYLSADDIAYMEATPEYFRDNFNARIVGGRRSQQIFSELSDIIKTEVAAGKRSSADFVEIKESESLREAKEILKASDARLQELAQQSEDANNQTKLQMNEASNQASKENREDEQQAQKDIQDSVNATKIEDTKLKIVGDIRKTQIPPLSAPALKKPPKK